MVNSDIDMANMALSRIGAKPITTLSGGDSVSITVNLFFKQTLDEVLREHEWPCATTRSELAPVLSTEEPTDWTYRYQLPASPFCLRVLRLYDPTTGSKLPDLYAIEGRHLLCNYDTVGLVFIGRVSEYTHFDALLVEAIVLKLASKLAISIARDGKQEIKLLNQYAVVLNQARISASVEGVPFDEDAVTSWGDLT